MRRRIAGLAAPYCILVIPLLLETGQKDFVQRILVVDTPEPLQFARVKARDDLSEEKINAIIQAQISRSERLAATDDIITNDGDLDELRRQTARLDEIYRRLANPPGTP